jgi:hypothetical protein
MAHNGMSESSEATAMRVAIEAEIAFLDGAIQFNLSEFQATRNNPKMIRASSHYYSTLCICEMIRDRLASILKRSEVIDEPVSSTA